MEEKTPLRKISSETQFSVGDFEMETETVESQILALEEQLVAAIIENQNLVQEMKRLRAIGAQEELLHQLQKEKEKNRILSDKIRDYERDKEMGLSEAETSDEKDKAPQSRDKPPRSLPQRIRKRFYQLHKSRSFDNAVEAIGKPALLESTAKAKASDAVAYSFTTLKSPSRGGRFGWRRRALAKSKSLDQSEFLASLALEGADGTVITSSQLVGFEPHFTDVPEGVGSPIATTPRRQPVLGRLEEWLLRKLSTVFEDFSEITEEDSKPVDDEGEQLTIRKLKENVVRSSAILQPLNDYFSQIKTLLRWDSPAATFLVLSTYFASIIRGYIVALGTLLVILSLSRNYFRKRGWPFKLLRPKKGKRKDPDEGDAAADSKLGDRFAVVLQVARRVQNVLGAASDAAEKIKNLLLWEHEAATQVYVMSWILFVASLVFWPSQLFTFLGIYIGIKLFIIDYIFYKFPRVRRKYDTTSRLWDTLPTDADLGKRSEKNGVSPTEVKPFIELFNLPPSEVPLPGWQGGKRCTLVNRDKSLTSAFRNGRLYLTNSYLCFERSKSNPEKNIKLAICDVVTLEKANSYPWIPGGGMAIEILAANEKVYFFGGIINRDEVFDAIMDCCRQTGQPSPTKNEKGKDCCQGTGNNENSSENHTDSLKGCGNDVGSRVNLIELVD